MSPQVIALQEYKAKSLAKTQLSDSLGEILWNNYHKGSRILTVKFPDPTTQYQWEITPQGWVGYIQLSDDLALHLQPKVSLASIFGMLDYAYRLKSFRFLDGLAQCDSIENLFDHLAGVLARRISDRTRQGLYRAYLNQTQQQQYIRGRLDIPHQIRHPWSTHHRCHFQEQSADIIDNQILLFTLRKIALQLPFQARSLIHVRRAYHALQNSVSLTAVSSQNCVNRHYHRLNEDYRPLHALCRFFLEQSGPSHRIGDRTMLPFLVDMARLYELFVAEWLKAHSEEHLKPRNLEVKAQERVYLDDQKSLHFNIDLVLSDTATGKTRYVLDTKYKTPVSLSPNDTAKINTYAAAQDCCEAVLV